MSTVGTGHRDAARRQAWMLYHALSCMSESDPEQDVTSITAPVLEDLLGACMRFAEDDPCVQATAGLANDFETGPLRADDAATVVRQLAAALGPETGDLPQGATSLEQDRPAHREGVR